METRRPDRRWGWIAVDVVLAYLSAVIPVGPSDVTASVLDGPVVVRAAAVVWFLAIALRRLAPVAALAGGAAATVAVALTGHPVTNLSLATALAVTMVVQTRPRRRALAVTIPPVAVALTALAFAADNVSTVVIATFVHGAAWLTGEVGRGRWEAQLARHDLAVANERARLTRELHDAVGHAVTVMVTHAGAARLSLGAGNPAVAGALADIEDVGRRAMTDLERILGLLEAAPVALTDSVRSLVAALPASVPVSVDLGGDLDGLSPPVADTVHRIVQESLTNVLRHAAPTTATVRVRREGGAVHVEVRDEGAGPGQATEAGTATGRGLAGMAQRVRLVGGVVAAGPDGDRGWRVAAEIPA
ncbi:sensor histidine kinase [Dactylosporangium sp. CA-233914]|uniref:sensor histidine kinase n=1 Tax=Dactylosporangium sp. CA-233914 TaxID=3239934 RepID=UPI003D91198D